MSERLTKAQIRKEIAFMRKNYFSEEEVLEDLTDTILEMDRAYHALLRNYEKLKGKKEAKRDEK